MTDGDPQVLVCPCGKHTKTIDVERVEPVSVGRGMVPFEWIVTFPDLPLATFDALDAWIADCPRAVTWGKWTVRLDHRVSAAAIRGRDFADLAALVALVDDWHTWCGATVHVPPIAGGAPRWRRLAKACAEAAEGELHVTVAWSIDGYGLDHGTSVLFVDGHYAAEVVPLLDPAIDAGDIPF